MIRANIETQIQRLEVKICDLERDEARILNLIDNLAQQHKVLEQQRSDLLWKVSELKEELEND